MWRVGNIFLPDIEHIYMSEKKSNHVKEIYVSQLINVPILAEGNVQKVAGKIYQTQTIQSSHGVNGLAQNCKNTCPPTQWVRVE